MKDNPALPGGSSKSKPTWWNTLGCSATSAFFAFSGRARSHTAGRMQMVKSVLIRGQCPGERSLTGPVLLAELDPDEEHVALLEDLRKFGLLRRGTTFSTRAWLRCSA